MGLDPERERTVFVTNIHDDVTEDLLLELFIQAGPVNNLRLVKNDRAMAFVEFKHEESVPYALALLNGVTLFKKPLTLKARDGTEMAKKIAEAQKLARENELRTRSAYQSPPFGQHLRWCSSDATAQNRDTSSPFPNFSNLSASFLNPLCFSPSFGNGQCDRGGSAGSPFPIGGLPFRMPPPPPMSSYPTPPHPMAVLTPPPPPPQFFPTQHQHQQPQSNFTNVQNFYENGHQKNQSWSHQNDRYQQNSGRQHARDQYRSNDGNYGRHRSRSSNRYR